LNYYEHHIGDYAAATGHLSWDEDAAYRRLLSAYYHHEAAIPADIKAACRLVRASTPAQRQAVETVLHEFFQLRDDGWHQGRCDSEIAKFVASEPDREAKKENVRERQRRTRERRKAMFDALRERGIVPEYDASVAELQAMLSRVTAQHVTTPVTRDATATQTHYPDPDPDPGLNTHTSEAPPFRATPTDAGRVSGLMRRAGLSDGSPGNPDLLALIAAGASDAEFVAAAEIAVSRGKGFAYAIGALKNQRKEIAAQRLPQGAMPPPGTPTARAPSAAEQRALQAVPSIAAPHLRAVAPPAVFVVEEVRDALAIRLG